MVFLVLIGASIFSLVFRGLGGDELVHEWLANLPGGVIGAMVAVMVLMFLLGFVLDFIEITYVVVPLVGPVLLMMGLDPIWLGVMIAINLQTSFLTPPFGFALFYLRGVAPDTVATMQIYRGGGAVHCPASADAGYPRPMARVGHLAATSDIRLLRKVVWN